jgi:hypothetical protein
MKVGIWLVLVVLTILLLPAGFFLIDMLIWSRGQFAVGLSNRVTWPLLAIMAAPFPLAIACVSLGISIRHERTRKS